MSEVHAIAYQAVIYLLKYSLQVKAENVSNLSRSKTHFCISSTRLKSWQYLLLNNYSLNEYEEMPIPPVLGIEAFCQTHVFVCEVGRFVDS